MQALKNMPISFPGLFGDWEFNPDPIAVHIGHGIYWYGIILAFAMLMGLWLGMKQAKRFGLTEDNVLDMILWAVPCCILGSRIYYVLFYLDLYRLPGGGLDWGRVVAIWDGGLAIYGTVIAGVLVVFFYTRRKKLSFFAMTDLCAMGLLLGQAIGRWANFINREAFGGLTELPWRMRIWISAYQYADVHPTFLYESLWNLAGLLLILLIVSKGRRFDGENTAFYFLWYGLGRCWIEGLRTDSLYLFGLSFFGEPIRVSQALSFLLALAGACTLFWFLRVRRVTADGLFVNRQREEFISELEDILESHAAAETGEEKTESASETDTKKTESVLETEAEKTETEEVESALKTDMEKTESVTETDAKKMEFEAETDPGPETASGEGDDRKENGHDNP